MIFLKYFLLHIIYFVLTNHESILFKEIYELPRTLVCLTYIYVVFIWIQIINKRPITWNAHTGNILKTLGNSLPVTHSVNPVPRGTTVAPGQRTNQDSAVKVRRRPLFGSLVLCFIFVLKVKNFRYEHVSFLRATKTVFFLFGSISFSSGMSLMKNFIQIQKCKKKPQKLLISIFLYLCIWFSISNV